MRHPAPTSHVGDGWSRLPPARINLGDVTLARRGRVQLDQPVHLAGSARLKEVPEPRRWRWRPSC